MIYFLALLPATGLTVAGYFVWYLSARSEGGMRTFGRYLGFWAFTLAALVILAAIFAAAHGGHRGFHMHGMHGGMHGPWPDGPRSMGPRGERPNAGEPPGEPPAAPTAPAGSPNASDSSGSSTPAQH